MVRILFSKVKSATHLNFFWQWISPNVELRIGKKEHQVDTKNHVFKTEKFFEVRYGLSFYLIASEKLFRFVELIQNRSVTQNLPALDSIPLDMNGR